MQAQTETTQPVATWHVFLFDAAGKVTRAFWHRRQRSGFFLFGGCLFWILVWYLVVAWYTAKAIIYSTVIMALVIAQGAVLTVDGCETAWRWAAWKVRRNG